MDSPFKTVALIGKPHHEGANQTLTGLYQYLTSRGFRVLLMSDSGAATERQMLRKSLELVRCDVLVLGRHGEAVFATSEFLAHAQPQVIILSQADPFRDGSGEEALRSRLTQTGATIFNQADCGAVTISIAGNTAEIRGYLNKQILNIQPR